MLIRNPSQSVTEARTLRWYRYDADDDVAYPPVYAALKRKRADDDGDGEDDE
jgi:hypothetical protein